MSDLEKLVPMPSYPYTVVEGLTFMLCDRKELEQLRSDTAKAVAQRCVEICNYGNDPVLSAEYRDACRTVALLVADEFGLERVVSVEMLPQLGGPKP